MHVFMSQGNEMRFQSLFSLFALLMGAIQAGALTAYAQQSLPPVQVTVPPLDVCQIVPQLCYSSATSGGGGSGSGPADGGGTPNDPSGGSTGGSVTPSDLQMYGVDGSLASQVLAALNAIGQSMGYAAFTLADSVKAIYQAATLLDRVQKSQQMDGQHALARDKYLQGNYRFGDVVVTGELRFVLYQGSEEVIFTIRLAVDALTHRIASLAFIPGASGTNMQGGYSFGPSFWWSFEQVRGFLFGSHNYPPFNIDS